MLTLAGTWVDVCGDTMKEMFKSRCKVFMQLDRGKIILNKTVQVIFISKKAPGKRHLHNGKTYPRCNSSPDIMGITGKFEPCFQTRFSISKVKCRSRYSSTCDRMTREYHTSDDVRVARALVRDEIKSLLLLAALVHGTYAERVFWWQRRKFGFKVYSERSVFSRDLITTMSSRITVTNVCLIQWDICFKLWWGLWFMLCRNGTQLNYIILCLFNLTTPYLFSNTTNRDQGGAVADY